MNSNRIIGIAGMIAFVIGSVIIYEACIPDRRRGHFDTPQEAAAYDEAWKRGEAHLELQKRIYENNTAIYKYSLLAVSVSLLALSFRRGRKTDKPLNEKK